MKKLTIFSFGFKYRRPPANNYFDVSFIKNPAREKQWGLFSKINKEMTAFVLHQPLIEDFIKTSSELIYLLQSVDDDCRVAFGCSAGRHRSPIIADVVSQVLSEVKNIKSVVKHLEREIDYGIL